jgi:predicted DNA-binding mobile mystery protein A
MDGHMKEKVLNRLRRKDKDALRLRQLEETFRPLREFGDVTRPSGGWVRAVREGLGMTNVQLTKNLKKRAPQSIEDMQKSELTETIQLKTLRRLAEALGCRLVYAIVPPLPLDQIRRNRARAIAERLVKQTSHSMRLEAQGVSQEEEQREQESLIEKILADNPKILWQ